MKRFVLMMLLIFLISLSGEAQTNRILDKSDNANTVNIKDNSFQPFTLTVPAGTAVTWHNQDERPAYGQQRQKRSLRLRVARSWKEVHLYLQQPGELQVSLQHSSWYAGIDRSGRISGNGGIQVSVDEDGFGSFLYPGKRPSIRSRWLWN